MVMFERGGGGAVFATGSIAWIGALLWNDGDNDVSRITGNVLGRFLDPRPLNLVVQPGRSATPADDTLTMTDDPGAISSP